jgi:hypothetical protein
MGATGQLVKLHNRGGDPGRGGAIIMGYRSQRPMAHYAQFFHLDLAGNLAEACGDRAIIRLDGRQGQHTHEFLAEKECKKRGFIAWQLISGSSLLQAKPYTKVTSLYY